MVTPPTPQGSQDDTLRDEVAEILQQMLPDLYSMPLADGYGKAINEILVLFAKYKDKT